MKRRKILVFSEILLTIISFLCVCVTIFYGFSTLDHLFFEKTILNINKKNIEIINKYIKMSSDYNEIPSIENAKNIQYFLSYDVDEYTIVYNDGTKKVFNDYDRELIGLRDYIEDRGHKQYYYDGMITIIFGIISITSYCTAKHIGNKIEFQDKLEMEKILSEQI